MTDPISSTTTTSIVAPAYDDASSGCASAEPGPALLMPDPLPQSSCSIDPAFAIGALYVQMLHTERSDSRKNAAFEEANIERKVDEKIHDMREAAHARFAQSVVSGLSKVGSGFLEAMPGLREMGGAEVTDSNRMLYQGSAQGAGGFGELGAGNYGRDASQADQAAERHDSNAEAAKRRQLVDNDAGSDLRSQLERVLGYMDELEQSRAQAFSAAVLRV